MNADRIALALAAIAAGVLVLAAGVDEELDEGPGSQPKPDTRIASPELRAAILDAFAARGYDRDEADRTVTAESGWRPHALYRGADGQPGAAGLIQMTGQSLRINGWTAGSEAFAAASEATQWPVYRRYIERMPRGRVPGDSRLALFWPIAVLDGWYDDVIIASVISTGLAGRAWAANPSLREGYPRVEMGPITAGSVRATVRRLGPA